MKSYSSREVIQLLEADGWFEVNVVGSHHQFKHPTKKGRVTVKHPDKDIPVKPSPALNDSLGYCSGNPDLLTYLNRRSFYETGRTLFLSRCL